MSFYGKAHHESIRKPISSAYLWRILNWRILGRQTQRQPRTWPLDLGRLFWNGHGILSMKKTWKKHENVGKSSGNGWLMLAKSNDPKEKWKTPEIHKKTSHNVTNIHKSTHLNLIPLIRNIAQSKVWFSVVLIFELRALFGESQLQLG